MDKIWILLSLLLFALAAALFIVALCVDKPHVIIEAVLVACIGMLVASEHIESKRDE